MRTFEIVEPGGADRVRFGTREVPAVGPGEVRIRVSYAGLNFTDVLARRGAPGYAATWPYVPGMEVGGVVDAVGEGVDTRTVGDVVVAFTTEGGGFAEYAVADARLTEFVPDGIDLAAATTVPLTWATALGLLRAADPKPGERVLVTSAAGGVGAAIGAVSQGYEGIRLFGGIGSAAKSSALHSSYTPVLRDDHFYDTAVEAAGGPFDAILDSIGGHVLDAAASHLQIEGRLVSYGGAAGEPDPAVPAYGALRAGNHTVRGFSILRLARSAPERAGALIRDMMALTRTPLTLTQPTIVDWPDLIDAHLRQSEGVATGKTVVKVG